MNLFLVLLSQDTGRSTNIIQRFINFVTEPATNDKKTDYSSFFLEYDDYIDVLYW